MSGTWGMITGHTMKRERDKMQADAEKQRKELERSQSEEARKEAELKEAALLRKKRGRASTLLTGGQGLGGWGEDRSPKATLLGE